MLHDLLRKPAPDRHVRVDPRRSGGRLSSPPHEFGRRATHAPREPDQLPFGVGHPPATAPRAHRGSTRISPRSSFESWRNTPQSTTTTWSMFVPSGPVPRARRRLRPDGAPFASQGVAHPVFRTSQTAFGPTYGRRVKAEEGMPRRRRTWDCRGVSVGAKTWRTRSSRTR